MKTTFLSKFKLFLFCLFFSGLSFAQTLTPQSYSGVEYLAGGIGQDEARAMHAQKWKWPLSLEFSQHDGYGDAWITEVQLKINDDSGKLIFDIFCDAPQILVRLPAGMYEIVANYRGAIQRQKVQVTGKEVQQIYLSWMEKKR